jgi:hypothetical protein
VLLAAFIASFFLASGGLVSGVAGLRTGLLAVAIGSAVMVLPVLLSPVSRLRAMPASER